MNTEQDRLAKMIEETEQEIVETDEVLARIEALENESASHSSIPAG